MLQRFNGDLSPSKVIFQHSSFWIRVFNVHILSINRTIGIHIANEIGTPPLVDAPKSSLAWGPFLRIRVDIDITKPLMKGKIVHIEDVEEGWVFLSMRDYLPSAIVVVFLVIKIMNVKKKINK